MEREHVSEQPAQWQPARQQRRAALTAQLLLLAVRKALLQPVLEPLEPQAEQLQPVPRLEAL